MATYLHCEQALGAKIRCPVRSGSDGRGAELNALLVDGSCAGACELYWPALFNSE